VWLPTAILCSRDCPVPESPPETGELLNGPGRVVGEAVEGLAELDVALGVDSLGRADAELMPGDPLTDTVGVPVTEAVEEGAAPELHPTSATPTSAAPPRRRRLDRGVVCVTPAVSTSPGARSPLCVVAP